MNHEPKDYEINIRYSAAEGDQCFIAQVVEWPEVMAHGDTLEEAAHEIQAALRLSLKTADELGVEIPEPRSVLACA